MSVKAKSGDCILSLNVGSSSIRFAVHQAGGAMSRGLHGKVDRIGLGGMNLAFNDGPKNQWERIGFDASDHKSAAGFLIDWFDSRMDSSSIRAIGHRVVHGMKHTEPEIVTPELLEELQFLGIEVNEERNTGNAGVISSENASVTVRVIRTDEERMIARLVCRVLGIE